MCAAWLAGCGSKPAEPSGAADPRSAPEIVTIGGQAITLAAALWRDFMPISPQDGKPLIAVFTATTVRGQAFPAGVTADRAWVFLGTDTWETSVTSEQQTAPGASSLVVVAHEGPKWGPNVDVDVAIRLRDSAGTLYLLQAKRLTITATY
jgi:hypothetical protein